MAAVASLFTVLAGGKRGGLAMPLDSWCGHQRPKLKQQQNGDIVAKAGKQGSAACLDLLLRSGADEAIVGNYSTQSSGECDWTAPIAS